MPINLSVEYPKLQNEVMELRMQRDNLLDIAKQVAFWFGNEANYPEGTNGYRICQQAKAAIKESKKH